MHFGRPDFFEGLRL